VGTFWLDDDIIGSARWRSGGSRRGRVGDSGTAAELVSGDTEIGDPPTLDKFLLRREFGLVWMRECLVSSSDREKRLLQPGNEHECGFSPVCVRMWRVWCSSRWKALSHMGHLYGLEAESLRLASGLADIMLRKKLATTNRMEGV